MNIIRNIGDRISSAVWAVIAAVFIFICGILLAFVLSPQQALEWRHIQGLPDVNATSLASVEVNEEVTATGQLEGNAELTPDGLVAYTRETWEVEPADPDVENSEPGGSWRELESRIPALTLNAGGAISILEDNSLSLSGNVAESIERGSGAESATYGSETLPEGSIRTRGFENGTLVTVVGRKASTGDIAPNRLYGGDRVQLIADIRSGARVLFMVGVALMACSPVVLILGVLGAIFGRVERTESGGRRITFGRKFGSGPPSAGDSSPGTSFATPRSPSMGGSEAKPAKPSLGGGGQAKPSKPSLGGGGGKSAPRRSSAGGSKRKR